MKLLGPAFTLSLAALLAGCATSSHGVRAAADPADPSTEAAANDATTDSDAAIEAPGVDVADAKSDATDADPRQVGDYVTFAFTGAYRKAPLKLTRRVVARSQGSITLDYAFTEGTKTDTLRAVLAAGEGGEVLSVAHVQPDGSTKPATPGALEAKMAGTAAVADENEALLDERRTTMNVGEAEIGATRSTYKVRVGKKSATLETTTSEGFAWGDLGGKITTEDGVVFFQAQLVDAGGPSSARASL
ncbi:MAG: hypothetical protein IPM79_30960 [Polyangiaceae bacterium]|nr:hypothetical protein [Polyangiaceae bacterium]